MAGKVILVGAGPGDEGLITLKGLQALRAADVVVYDHLGCESLLNEADPEARLIYAGKEAGHHYLRQHEIQALLIDLARQGKNVVRLKGGDPFVFGRGGEEMLSLREAGIHCEIISGVSSCYSVPASAGIPVTYRKMSSAFHVVTAHEDPLKAENTVDYRLLAREKGTLVFLMGVRKLEQIAERLIREGKSPDTPTALICQGTTGHQQSVVAPLKEIAQTADNAGVTPPGLLVVGDVASLCRTESELTGALSGKRILVTAFGETARKLKDLIRMAGGEPVALSLITTRPRSDFDPVQMFDHMPATSWLVFTSRNGVHYFFDAMKEAGVDVRRMSDVRIAVIGRGTAKALKDHGIYPDLMPEAACSESLTGALCSKIREEGIDRTGKVYLLRARESSDIPVTELSRMGIDFEDIALYETQILTDRGQQLSQAMSHVDLITFCSSSAVKAFDEMYDVKTMTIPAAYIGPVSAGTARKLNMPVDIQAKTYDLEGLTQAIADYYDVIQR